MTPTNAASAWVRQQLEVVDDENLVESVRLDSILGASYVRPWRVAEAQNTYLDALGECAPASAQLMLALVISLTSAEHLVTDIPDLDDLDISDIEPPTLYLFNRQFFAARFNDFEEYRVPVDAKLPQMPAGRVHTYYSCFRYPLARARGWEFSRAIWYQHFNNQ